jgi:hypothetical protein
MTNNRLYLMFGIICVIAIIIGFLGYYIGIFETAEGECEVSFQPPTTTVDPDSQFVLQVLITPVDNPVRTYEIDIDFDPEYLQVLQVRPSDDFFGTGGYVWLSPTVDNDEGYIDDMQAAASVPATEPGIICEITFESQIILGTTALDFLNLVFTSDGYETIPVIGFSGEVTIGPDKPPSEAPGFEILTFVIALGIALTLIKKRR